MEFLIRPLDGDWFGLPVSRFDEVLRPRSFGSQRVEGPGEHRIQVHDCPISFWYEDPGIQVCFEGAGLTEHEAAVIVHEIAENISIATGQRSKVVPL